MEGGGGGGAVTIAVMVVEVAVMTMVIMMRRKRSKRMLHELFSDLLQAQEQILTTVCVQNPNLCDFGEYGRAVFFVGGCRHCSGSDGGGSDGGDGDDED